MVTCTTQAHTALWHRSKHTQESWQLLEVLPSHFPLVADQGGPSRLEASKGGTQLQEGGSGKLKACEFSSGARKGEEIILNATKQ